MRTLGRFATAAAIAAATIATAVALPLSPWSPASLPTARAAQSPAAGCAQVAVVLVRGAGEAAPAGRRLPVVAQQLTAQSARTVETIGLDFPADMPAKVSKIAGASAMQTLLAGQAAACPRQRFVLVGYEVGSEVVGFSLTGLPANDIPPLDPALGAKVAAVILFEDPARAPGEPFNAGTADPDLPGTFPRAVGAFGALTPNIRSYCESGDPVCSSGDNPAAASVYGVVYVDEAVTFVLGRTG